jgi:hypothetical protein
MWNLYLIPMNMVISVLRQDLRHWLAAWVALLSSVAACGARTGLGDAAVSPNAFEDAGAADGPSTASAPACDSVSVDFSVRGLNPNGVWSYGWSSTLGSSFNPYTFYISPTATSSVDPNAAGLALWSSADLLGPGGYLPAVFLNPLERRT